MVQSHAFDAWVSPGAKASGAYAVTRTLGTLALPTFLLLAGVGVGIAVERAFQARAADGGGGAVESGDAARLRARLTRRGAEVVLGGYALSLAMALLDTGAWPGAAALAATVLRADVLHAIGLSVVLGAWFAASASSARAFRVRVLALGAATAALCPWLSRAGALLEGAPLAVRALAGLFVDVPGVTRFPVVPLFAWFAVGAAASPWLRGLTPVRAAWLLGTATLAATGFTWLSARVLVWWPGPFSRAHGVVWPNLADLLARAAVVVALGALLVHALRGRRVGRPLLRWLVFLGQHSLLVYALHLPFAYGSLGRALQAKLAMPAASAAVLGLVLLTSLLVWAALRLHSRVRSRVRGLAV